MGTTSNIKNRLLTTVLAAMLTTLAGQLWAQEKRTVYLSLIYSDTSKGQLIGACKSSYARLIKTMQTGEVVTKSNPDKKENFDDPLGVATILSSNDSIVYFSVQLNADRTTRGLKVADLLKIKVHDTLFNPGFITGNLPALGWYSLNSNREAYCSLYELEQRHLKNAAEADAWLLDTLMSDVQGFFKEFSHLLNGEVFTNPITEGRYRGKTGKTVLQNLTRQEVEAFLWFVISYPGKYIGVPLKFNETIATWVINKGLYSGYEVLNAFNQLKSNGSAFMQYLNTQPDLLKDKDMAYNMALNAENLLFWSEDLSEKGFEATLLYSKTSGQMDGAGLVYLYRAEHAHNREDYQASLFNCRLSENIFTKLDNPDRMLDVFFKKAYNYYTLSLGDSALLELRKIYPLVLHQSGRLVDYNPRFARFKYYQYCANSYFKSGRYPQALQYIDSAISGMQPVTNQTDYAKLAQVYSTRAQVLHQQQRNDMALEDYRKCADAYREGGDFYQAAVSRIDVAIAQFRLGQYKESNELLEKLAAYFKTYNDANNYGLCYSQIGQNYWNLSEYDKAITAHLTAISKRQQAGNRSGEAFSWHQLGTLYQHAGKKTLAMKALDSAAVLYRILNRNSDLADVLLALGKVYKNDRETEKAADQYRLAANLLANAGSQSGYADALFELGLLKKSSDSKIAYACFDSCRLLNLKNGRDADAAYALMNLGDLEKNKGATQKGRALYEQAKKLVQQLNEPHALAHYYKSLGYDANSNVQYDSALYFFSKALQVFDSTDQEQAIQMRFNIAYTYQNKGLYDEAEQIFTNILDSARKANRSLQTAEACIALAWINLDKGKLPQGKQLIDSAGHYYQLSGNTNNLAYVSSLRGELNRKLFNFKEAHRWYSHADSIYAADNTNPWQRSYRMFNFVVLYYYQGDYRRSLDYTFKALQLRPWPLQDDGWFSLKTALAENYYFLNQTDSTLYYCNEVQRDSKNKTLSATTSALVSLLKARILADNKQYAAAIPLLYPAVSDALYKGNKNIYQQGLVYLSMAHRGAGRADSALYYRNQAVQFALQFELPSFSWEALYRAGLDAYTQQQYDEAAKLLKQAVDLLNRQAANLFGGEDADKLFRQHPAKADLYNKLMSALSKTNRADEAWQYATLAQAAAITDLSGGINLKQEDSTKQQALQLAREKYEQVQVLRQALDSTRSTNSAATPSARVALLEKTKAVAEAEYLNYIDQLKQQYKDLNTYFANQVDPAQFRNLHKRLPADMAMLMYVVHGRELMIFWATREKHGIITGALPEGFEYTAEQWLLALKNPQRPAGAGPLVLRTQIGKLPPRTKSAIDVQTGGNQLYTWLIEPVMPLLSGKTTWCIIPNGKLSHLPFHAMGQKDSTGKFSFLATRHTVFYTNNPADLFMSWDRRDKASFSAFGNPDETLASAGDEVKNIAGLYKTAQVYTAGEATVEKAMESLRSRQYVHFATHGVLKYPDFNNSYLVFAPDKASPNGGRLTLQDIQSLSIEGCDLVTLSACETAVSAELGNGWYISPANAFLLNYVRSVVASLWEVDDKSTSLLMQQFYKHLLIMPKAVALRQAMADVSAVKEFEHPFYWAGFVLYGDWK